MNSDLRRLLLADNPWLAGPEALDPWLKMRLPATLYRRLHADAATRRWSEVGRAHLVVGPRQAGKSTLIWNYLAGRGEPALFLDCEQALVRELCRSAPLFLAELNQIVDRPVTLFLEEIQHLDEAGLFVKGLVDRRVGVPILVTGSSSYHLGAATRESLAGRATRTQVLPLSLAEVTGDLTASSPIARASERQSRLDRHLRFGGYPAVWSSVEPERHLADLVEAVILRDASDLRRITRPDAFRRLLRLIAGQAGSLTNLSEWSSIVGLGRDTVASYLEILEVSHIVVSVPPFAGGRRAELTSRHKVYLVDGGVRNHLVGDFRSLTERADRGAVLESWVFTEIWKVRPAGATVHFWRSTSNAEVDFVIVQGERITGVEAKAATLTRPTLTRGSRSFIEAYAPQQFFVVNTGVEHERELGRTNVIWLQPTALAAAIAQE